MNRRNFTKSLALASGCLLSGFSFPEKELPYSLEILPDGRKQYFFKGDLNIAGKECVLFTKRFLNYGYDPYWKKRDDGDIEIFVEGNYIECSTDPNATTYEELGVDPDYIDNLIAYSTHPKFKK